MTARPKTSEASPAERVMQKHEFERLTEPEECCKISLLRRASGLRQPPNHFRYALGIARTAATLNEHLWDIKKVWRYSVKKHIIIDHVHRLQNLGTLGLLTLFRATRRFHGGSRYISDLTSLILRKVSFSACLPPTMKVL